MKLITGFIVNRVDHCVERFMQNYSNKMSMDYCLEQGSQFKNFTDALEAIYITFHLNTLPIDGMQEARHTLL